MAYLTYDIEVDLYETERFDFEPDRDRLLKVIIPLAKSEMKDGDFKVDHDDVYAWLDEYEDFLIEMYEDEIKEHFLRDAIEAFTEMYMDPYSYHGVSRKDFQ